MMHNELLLKILRV